MYGYNGKKIFVEYLGQMTLIDGKVLNIMSGCNSCQSCPICGAKPTQLLNIKDINSEVFKAKTSALQYGVSPLHAWIRFFEFVLKLSYRVEMKKWHVKDCDKPQLIARKQLIQRTLLKEMGLNVDKPIPNGSGNSNDGNTARRAFSDVALLASILNVEEQLLKNFYIILVNISYEHKLAQASLKPFVERFLNCTIIIILGILCLLLFTRY